MNAQLHIIKTKFNKKRCYITGNNRSRSDWFLWGHITYNNKTVSRQSPAETLGVVTLQNLWRQRVTVQCYPRTLSARWGVESFIKGCNKPVNDWSLGKTVNFISLKSQTVIECLLTDNMIHVNWQTYIWLCWLWPPGFYSVGKQLFHEALYR